MKRKIVQGITGKKLESVEVMFGVADGSDTVDVRFQNRTALIISLKEPAIALKSIQLRDWRTGKGRLLKDFDLKS